MSRGLGDVYKRQVLHRLQCFTRLCADALRWGINGYEFGILAFETLQFPHEPIVLGVGNLYIVERVVAIVVIPNLIAQGFDFLEDVRH